MFQVEYASKAVEATGTVIALRGKDGVVFASENIITSKLHESSSYYRTHAVDTNIGIAFAGVVPDGLMIVNEARNIATDFRGKNGTTIPVKHLNARLAGVVHQFTLYGHQRPVGVSVLVGGYDPIDGPELYQIEPSAEAWGYHGAAAGKAKQNAHSELEKADVCTLIFGRLVA